MVWQRARGLKDDPHFITLTPCALCASQHLQQTVSLSRQSLRVCELGLARAPDAGKGLVATGPVLATTIKDREGCVGMPTLAVEANGT